ncbi:MAG: hypothetical protein PHR06_12665 [Candidatus Cloacimonetes bacterium]|nr:hypothetical protein [Candidatus Cloacimonadota bacterium]
MIEALSTSIKNSITEIVSNINSLINDTENASKTIVNWNENKTTEEINSIDEDVELIPEGFLKFTIDDGKIVFGSICQNKKKDIYVKDDRTLYIIRKKKLKSIENRNQENITEQELTRSGYSRINYNYYKNIVEIK